LRWWALLGAVSSVVFAACSGSGSTSASGALRIGFDFSSEFTNSFDPAKSSGNCDAIVTTPIYDTLLHLSPGGALEPGLATSWSVNGDYITIHLRPGVEFSNGEPFNAQAVKIGLLHDKLNTTLDDLANINAITVDNPLTLTIQFANNTGIELLEGMTGREGMIPAPDDLNKASSDPIGAGPYEFVSYAPGSELVLKQNPNYWDKSAYHLKQLDYIQVGVGPPGIAALEANSIDMVLSVSRSRSRRHISSSNSGSPRPSTTSTCVKPSSMPSIASRSTRW
jgi:peptide/nickel transport system substrate-binding protein